MKVLRILALIGSFVSLLFLVGTPIVQSQLNQKSQLVQRIQVDPSAELFGELGNPIGSPQRMIIEDKAAFLNKKSPEGAEYVSEAYLKEHKIYPLQVQTVDFISRNILIASGIAFALFTVLYSIIQFKQSKKS